MSKNDTIESFENFASKFLFQESIQQIDENMRRAQSIDAVNSQMFLFHGQKVSCDHIVNGSKGLLEIINQYLDSEDFLSQQDWCDEEKHRIQGYLGFVSKRASGMIPTVSSRIRTFVKSHKSYKNDSIISSEVCTDLIDYLCDWQPLGD